MTEKKKQIDEIIDYYPLEKREVREKLFYLLSAGNPGLARRGRLVILPVDQGVEHGPARSFAPNPEGYDPRYHPQLAIDAGCNGYVAPLGQMEAAAEFTDKIPCILKLNGHTGTMPDGADPRPSLMALVADAVRLGCVGVGFTIYPGSKYEAEQYEQLREVRAQAVERGLFVVVWSYPRGSGLPNKEAETAVDVIAYAAHIAAQLGAHIIKVKPPTNPVALDANKKVYEKYQIPVGTLAERISHVVQSAFNGRRIVIFSGGDAKSEEDVLTEIRQIKAGGGFGSIVGRNSFQRRKEEGIALLKKIIDIYAE